MKLGWCSFSRRGYSTWAAIAARLKRTISAVETRAKLMRARAAFRTEQPNAER